MIPEGWGSALVADVADIVSGGTPSTNVAEYWDGGIPWCTPTDITSAPGKVLNRTERTISEAGLASSAATLLPAGSLLLCTRATVGDVRIASVPTATNQGFKSLVIKPPNDNVFFYYQVSTLRSQLLELSSGSTFLELSKKDLARVPVLVPPPIEQREIAAALSDADSLVESLDALIAKKRDMKQAAMQQLLTGRTRLPGFMGEWQIVRLDKVAELSAGVNKPLSEIGQGTLYITVQDLYAGSSVDCSGLTRIRLSALEIEKYSLEVGDIIFGKSSVKRDGIGYPSRFLGADEPVVSSGFAYVGRAHKETCDSSYLFHVLRSEPVRRWVVNNSQASALTNINASIARSIPVCMPTDTHEQRAIAEALSDMDAEIDALVAQREKAGLVKQGMMQELLSGRVRLV